jgi:hypothetical protein
MRIVSGIPVCRQLCNVLHLRAVVSDELFRSRNDRVSGAHSSLDTRLSTLAYQNPPARSRTANASTSSTQLSNLPPPPLELCGGLGGCVGGVDPVTVSAATLLATVPEELIS